MDGLARVRCRNSIFAAQQLLVRDEDCLTVIVVHLGISCQVSCAVVFFESLLESFSVVNPGMESSDP